MDSVLRLVRGAEGLGRDLAGAELAGADLSGADLRGAVLVGANLVGANLMGANLAGAQMGEVKAKGANFGAANLAGAVLVGADVRGALFVGASLAGAELSGADGRDARFNECDLNGAVFCNADVRGAVFVGSDVGGASFRGADFRGGRISRLSRFEDADWIDANITDVDFRGAYDVRRFAHDENYLYEFRVRNRANAIVYAVWKATSDCGRSVGRWLAFTCTSAVLFGVVYSFIAIDFGANETALSPLYFSIVTSTTLGYGDALPTDALAQGVVMLQVIQSYLFLGVLVSILGEKFARRA